MYSQRVSFGFLSHETQQVRSHVHDIGLRLRSKLYRLMGPEIADLMVTFARVTHPSKTDLVRIIIENICTLFSSQMNPVKGQVN